MRLLFVNALIGGDFSTLDVSITLLATLINERSTHKAAIADTTFYRRTWKQYMAKKIAEFKPDMIGFSCNTLYMSYVREIAAFIKAEYGLPIIGGGYHATIYPDETMAEGFFDALLIGDADDKIIPVLDHFEKTKGFPKEVKGIIFKHEGNIVNTGKGDFCADINDAPFLDWDLWEHIDKYLYYLQMIYFVGTRGCFYTCPFCEACEISCAVDGSYYREMNPERYAQEIAYQWKKYKHRGMRLAQLFDPIPTFSEEWLKRFATEYKRLLNPREHPYSLFSRIDHLNETKIKYLAMSGCKIIRSGIEAGDDHIRNTIHKKGLTSRQIIRIVDSVKRHGMDMTTFFILGAPGESRETIMKTKKLAMRLDTSRSAFFIYKPITKTSLEMMQEQGNVLLQDRVNAVDNLQYGSVFDLSDISAKEVERLQRRIYASFLKRKLSRMLKKDGLSYFTHLAVYLTKGLLDGLELKYLLPYYHIYAYDHITM